MELPRYVQIEPVGQCNLRCQMCPVQFRRDGPASGAPAFMAFDTFTRLIDQFPQLEHLHLQGLGEPMMHPRFFDMVQYAVAKGVRVTTNTNLTVLNPRRAELCVTSGLDTVHVSIDAANQDTYRAIRVGSRLERVLRNLEFLADARRAADSPLPRLKLVTVIMRQNLEELAGLVELAGRFGVETMFVQHLCHDFGESTLPAEYFSMRQFVGDQTLLGEDPARIDYHFSRARQAAEAAGIELRLPRTQPRAHAPGTPGRQRCDWPWHGAYISYQGLAMPCCMIATPDRCQLGDFATTPAEDVWNGEPYARFRDALDSERPPEICSSCAVYNGVF
jgi:MoaA/NifB/PqqE/SkfB family radical SAM enzyme